MSQSNNPTQFDATPQPDQLLAELPVITFEKKELSPQLAEIPLETQLMALAHLSMETEIDDVLNAVLEAMGLLE